MSCPRYLNVSKTMTILFYCSFYIGVNYCGREEICSHIFHRSAGCSSFEIPYLEQLNSPQSGGECGRGKIKMLK